jgi:hypothetical protein
MVLLLPIALSAAVGREFKDEHLLRDTSHFRIAIAGRPLPLAGPTRFAPDPIQKRKNKNKIKEISISLSFSLKNIS